MLRQSIIIEVKSQGIKVSQLANLLPEYREHLIESNPDLLIVNPDSDTIGVAEVRSLVSWTAKKPVMAPVKIGLILDSQRLNSQGQNALLKTLEEPPQNTLIILHTQNAFKLLPTIVSRARQITAKLPTPEESTTVDDAQNLANQFLIGSLIEREQIIDGLVDAKSRGETQQFLVAILNSLLKEAKTNSGIRSDLIEDVKMCIQNLQAGGNLRLTLQTLAISID